MQQIFDMVCSGLLLAEVLAVWLYCRRRKKETVLLRQQERFLGEMAVAYTRVADVKEAIQEGIEPKDAMMTAEANRLLDSLEHDSPQSVMDYLSGAKNSFFSIFYAMCHAVRGMGDLYLEGQSLFVKNIQYIEEEVRMELLRIQNARYRFSGLLGLCALPFFLLPVIRSWALSIESGMSGFYDGSYGIGTTLICYVVSAVGMALVLWLHYPDLRAQRSYRLEQRLLGFTWLRCLVDWKIAGNYSRFLKKNEELKRLQGFGNIRQFLIRRQLTAVLCAALMLCGICFVKYTGRLQLRKEVPVPTAWTVELTETEKAQLQLRLAEAFRRMVDESADSAELSGEEWREYSSQIRAACIRLLEQQKTAFDGIRFRWYDALLVLVAWLFGIAVPELELSMCRWNVEQKKMEETLRFQTLILVLMHYPQMTIEELLHWLESFSELFRRALEKAVDSFSYQRKGALEQLRSDAGYEPVGRIADTMLSCDEVRIEDAFVNMESERNYYMDQYKQKVQAWTGSRAALAKVTAFLPFIVILALKLIVPFVMQGIQQLNLYSDGMATMF